MAGAANTDTAIVLEIQRLSTEDGPGIRTSVFFKGCPLACTWCHNPESIDPKPQIQWIESRCIGCRLCLVACPQGALSEGPHGVAIDRTLCVGCGTCHNECPSGAMELLGKEWTLDGLVSEVLKDRAYFEQSGGGVTATGGEPTVQAPFVARFLERLRAEGIHTALDTCGMAAPDALDRVLPHADLVLFDLKEIDPDRHKTFTGASNGKILANLLRVRDRMRETGMPRALWLRTPVIPGATAREANVAGLGRWIADSLDGAASRWELCSFNNLCRDKYTRLGLEWPFRVSELIGADRMEALAEAARKSGVDPAIVHWTGSTRMESAPAATREAPRLKVVR